MNKLLKIKIDEFGKTAVIRLSGEFYLGSISAMEDLWDRLIGKDPSVIGIDCHDLDFIDSSAIGTLVKFLHGTEHRGITMTLFDLNPQITRLFETAKLNTVFSIIDRSEFMKRYIEGGTASR
ncbi:MAG: STAS domain-containing protein [Spirochaetes bacterium]|nr:STAS domain-containing protein [Spirochaetota bacterium]